MFFTRWPVLLYCDTVPGPHASHSIAFSILLLFEHFHLPRPWATRYSLGVFLFRLSWVFRCRHRRGANFRRAGQEIEVFWLFCTLLCMVCKNTHKRYFAFLPYFFVPVTVHASLISRRCCRSSVLLASVFVLVGVIVVVAVVGVGVGVYVCIVVCCCCCFAPLIFCCWHPQSGRKRIFVFIEQDVFNFVCSVRYRIPCCPGIV